MNKVSLEIDYREKCLKDYFEEKHTAILLI